MEFVLEVFDGKNKVSKPVNIKIDNVNDLKASVNLLAEDVHEGTSVNSSIGNVNVTGDSNLSYSLAGTNSNDFYVSDEGKIKVKNNLDYSAQNLYDLTLVVEGENDQISLPLKIHIKENIQPNF